MPARPLAVPLLLALSQAPVSAFAQATNPPYMRESPTIEQVRARLRAADSMETAAIRMGAFWQLQHMINEPAGTRRYRNQLTPDEFALPN